MADEPVPVQQAFASTLDRCYEHIRAMAQEAGKRAVCEPPRYPAIVLRTPKGWSGPTAAAALAPRRMTCPCGVTPMIATRTRWRSP